MVTNGELAPLVCDFVTTCFELRQKYLEPFEIKNDNTISRTTCTRSGRLPRAPDRLIENC